MIVTRGLVLFIGIAIMAIMGTTASAVDITVKSPVEKGIDGACYIAHAVMHSRYNSECNCGAVLHSLFPAWVHAFS